MRILKFFAFIAFSALSFQAFAALPDLQVNSLVVCQEASTLSKAISALNLTVGSSAYKMLDEAGSYMVIKDYTSSQPTITKLDNGNVAVCVTLTQKSGWLASK